MHFFVGDGGVEDCVTTGACVIGQSKDVVAGNVVQAHGWPVVCTMYLLESPQSHHPPVAVAIAAHVLSGSAACSHVGVAPPPPVAVPAAPEEVVPLVAEEVRVYGMPLQVER